MWWGHAAVQIVTGLLLMRVCWALLSLVAPGLDSVMGMASAPVLAAVQGSS